MDVSDSCWKDVDQTWLSQQLWGLHSVKLTYPLTMVVFNSVLLFQGSIFTGYVSFREGSWLVLNPLLSHHDHHSPVRNPSSSCEKKNGKLWYLSEISLAMSLTYQRTHQFQLWWDFLMQDNPVHRFVLHKSVKLTSIHKNLDCAEVLVHIRMALKPFFGLKNHATHVPLNYGASNIHHKYDR